MKESIKEFIIQLYQDSNLMDKLEAISLQKDIAIITPCTREIYRALKDKINIFNSISNIKLIGEREKDSIGISEIEPVVQLTLTKEQLDILTNCIDNAQKDDTWKDNHASGKLIEDIHWLHNNFYAISDIII